jgi:hypothetical protein
VAEGVGATIIDPSSATDLGTRGVAIWSFTSFVDGEFLVIRRSNGPDNSLAQRFIDEFWAYHETLLAQP